MLTVFLMTTIVGKLNYEIDGNVNVNVIKASNS